MDISLESAQYCAIKKMWFNITKRASTEQTEKIDTDWEW
jgi:hypothetical protein